MLQFLDSQEKNRISFGFQDDAPWPKLAQNKKSEFIGPIRLNHSNVYATQIHDEMNTPYRLVMRLDNQPLENRALSRFG